MQDLQTEFDLTYIFVAHDLSVIKHVIDRAAVMYLGTIVEYGTNKQMFIELCILTQFVLCLQSLDQTREEK